MTGPQIEQDEIYPMPSFPMLQVSDLAASGRWYQDVLGFRHIFTMPGPGGEASLIHLRWRKYADLLLVSDRDTPKVSRGVGISLHFPLQEGTVDDLVERARAAGATIVRAPTDQPWNVRDATIADPNGYRLTFSHGPLRPIGTMDELIREMHQGDYGISVHTNGAVRQGALDMAAKAHSEELIYTSSEDGYLLEGITIRPPGAEPHPIGMVWIHGNAARFYDYPYIAIGRAMAAAGYLFISANTRGHDIATMLWRGSGDQPTPWQGPQAMPSGGGSAWERLEDAPRDLAAWVELAASLGAQSVVLAGHSSGAQRVVLYQAERQDARVAGLVLASPDLRGFIPPGELEAAQRLVAEGHELEVTPAQPFAPWYRQAARTVVDKAAVLSRLLQADEGEPTIAAIHSPILAFFGTNEWGGETTLATIRQNATAAHVETATIEGADHIYSGHEAEVAGIIARWVAALK